MTEYDNTNSGALFKNDEKDETHPNWPDYNGSIDVEGNEYWIKAWLKTAKGMDGGADINVFVDYAIFSNTPNSEDGSFRFVLMTPDLKSWGILFNDYPDSPLAKADEVWGEVADCSDSSLLSSVKVE